MELSITMKNLNQNKMTAVEKIIAEINNELQTLESLHGKEIFGRKVGLAFAKRVAEQAKEMEKEQIVTAHYQGYRNDIGTTEVSEQYYNETFKSE
jgi:hypothetical protein